MPTVYPFAIIVCGNIDNRIYSVSCQPFSFKNERSVVEIGTYDKIVEVCKLRKISISQMEREAGIKKNTVYKWNSCSPTLVLISKVADYLGVPIERFVADKD